MPGIGAIEGYDSLPRIEFTKRMPVCYVAKPGGGIITVREHLTSEGYACDRGNGGRFTAPGTLPNWVTLR